MTSKRIPERMCAVCRQMKPKTLLVRIVNGEHGAIVDLTGKMNGRGVYLCKCKQCIDKAVKGKAFAKQNGFSLDAVAAQLEGLIEG